MSHQYDGPRIDSVAFSKMEGMMSLLLQLDVPHF